VVKDIVHAPTSVTSWFAAREDAWRRNRVAAQVRSSTDVSINKAGITLEAVSLAATITVWGNGMLEFIVLDTVLKQERIVRDVEFKDPAELRQLLEECSEVFENLRRESAGG
jgi:hypothetical protein